MQLPLQITFRGFDSSESITDRITQKVQKLEQRCGRITSCRVVLDAPHQHHHKGKTFRVSIELSLPGAEITVNRDGGQDHAHEDVYVAIRDAFDAASRQLQTTISRGHGEEKRHEAEDSRGA
jgi:ribosomal subunit interface protein